MIIVEVSFFVKLGFQRFILKKYWKKAILAITSRSRDIRVW